MGSWWNGINSTARGFAIVLAIAVIVFVLNLEGVIFSLALIIDEGLKSVFAKNAGFFLQVKKRT